MKFDPLRFPCGHSRCDDNVYSYHRKSGYVTKLCKTCCNASRPERVTQRKPTEPKAGKYRGEKAGKIVYPGYVYGGTRLS